MHVAHVAATLAASLALTVALAGATGVVAAPAARVDDPTHLRGRNLLNRRERRRRRRRRRRRERRRQEREQEQAWEPPQNPPIPENTPIDDGGDDDGIQEPPQNTPAPNNDGGGDNGITEPPQNSPNNDGGDDTDTTSGSGSDDPDGLTAEHNRMREKHCVPDLQWDSELATKAQEWADTICDGSLRHSSNGPENLAMCSGRSGCMTAAQALEGWYTDEEPQYDYGNPGFSMAAGHFTQVVWKEAQKLGCGKCVQGTTETLVCNYDKGNMSGAFKENVPRPC